MPATLTNKEIIPDELIDAVLDHIARYRLTVFPALQQLPVFAACGPRRSIGGDRERHAGGYARRGAVRRSQVLVTRSADNGATRR